MVVWYEWSETKPAGNTNKDWSCVAESANGSVMLAAANPGRLYKSVNGGTSWTEITTTGITTDTSWQSVAVTADGATMLAAVSNGLIYKSVDGGISWNNTSPTGVPENKFCSKVSMSSDGKTMLASVVNGRVYYTTSFGIGWAETFPTGTGEDHNWGAQSVSSDGTTMLQAVYPGRLYKSTDSGTSWTETTPTGTPEDKFWGYSSVSSNGSIMLASVMNGRMYRSTNGGTSWSEKTPTGIAEDMYWVSVCASDNGNTILAPALYDSGYAYKSADGGTSWVRELPGGTFQEKQWIAASVSRDGSSMLAGAWNDRLYRTEPALFSPITTTTAAAKGRISTVNGANAANHGAIWYGYSVTDKVIGDPGVTNVDSTGVIGSGIFPVFFTGLTPNTRYNSRAHATNIYGTGYSQRSAFRTLANVPSAPTVNNQTVTTLDVIVNPNGNPDSTKFAIQDSVNNLYLKADGTRRADAVWQTAATWDTITVTGLTTGTRYYFRVKARNDDGFETAYSPTSSGIPCASPSISSQSTAAQTLCAGGTFSAISVTATGTGLSYQWYSNGAADTTGMTSLGSANGATTNSYTPQSATVGTLYYYCRVTGTCGTKLSAVSGAFVTNSLAAPPAPTANGTTICKGSAATLSATGTVTGTLGWYDAAVGGNWLHGGGSFTTSTLSNDTIYYVQDSVCTVSATRTAVTVNVSDICVSDTAGTVTLTISGNGSTISDLQTSVAGNILTITAVNSQNRIALASGISAGISGNNISTVTVNLNTYPAFAGISVIGGAGTDNVAIGSGGIDLSAVSGGASAQSVRINIGSANDQLTMANAITAKGLGNVYLKGGLGFSIGGQVSADTLTVISDGAVIQTAALTATLLVLGQGTIVDSCFNTIANGGNYTLTDSLNNVVYLSASTNGSINYRDANGMAINGSGAKVNGDITIKANGNLVVSGCGVVNPNPTGNVNLSTTSGAILIKNSGISSGGNVTLTSADSTITIIDKGVISGGNVVATSHRNMDVGSGGINTSSGTGNLSLTSSTGTVMTTGAGLNSKGKITVLSYGKISVAGNGIINSSGTGVDLTSSNGPVNIDGGGLTSQGEVNVVAAGAVKVLTSGINNTFGTGNLSITSSADSIIITSGGLQSKGKITVSSYGPIYGSGGCIVNSSGTGVDLTSTHGKIRIQDGGVTSKGDITVIAAGAVTASSGAFNNTMGTGNLSITSSADSVTSSGSGLQSKGKITVLAFGSISAFGSGIVNTSGTGVDLTSTNGKFHVQDGGLNSKGEVNVVAFGDVTSNGAGISNTLGTGNLSITSNTGSVTSTGFGLLSTGKITVLSYGNILTSGSGIDNSPGTGVDVTSTNGSVNFQSGTVYSDGEIKVVASGAVTVQSGGATNSSGTGNLSLTSSTDTISIYGSGIQSKGKVALSSYGNIVLAQGGIVNSSGKGVTVTSSNGAIKIQDGGVGSRDTVSVMASGNITLTGNGVYTPTGDGPVTLLSHNGTISVNSGGVNAKDNVIIEGDKLGILSNSALRSINKKVSIFPANNAVAIDLGGNDGTAVLGITDTELNYISGDTVVLGDLANTANIVVSSKISDALHKLIFVTNPSGGLSLSDSLKLKDVDISQAHKYSTTLLSRYSAQVMCVTGSVKLGTGTVLDLSTAATGFVTGDSIKIIDNGLSDPISGTFSGLAQNAIFSILDGSGSTVHLRISYTGGDGNDVVVRVTEVVPSVAWDNTNPAIFSPITTTTASATGKIADTNGAHATNRGAIVYAYTNTNKTIDSTGVTNIDSTGVFMAGTFPVTFTGLTPNTRYNARAHATNSYGTGYGARGDFRTLANVPSAPSVNNPTATTLDVAVNVNGNPAVTEFAIQDSVNNLYLKADGTRAADTVWQTAAQWDTITVTGLTTGMMYYFRVKARNGEKVETAFGLSTGQNTCANPANGGTIGTAQQICKGSTPAAFTSISLPSDYGGVLTYKWQYASADSTSFSDLANTDSVAYVPGALNNTTWYRRLARVTCKADWTGATPSNVIRVFVFPATVGGKVTGDTVVCYGNHSTVLILSGQTGSVLKWQNSTNGTTWNDINGSTNPTYTATNLTVNTWFRATVKNGECLVKNSDSLKISVFRDYRISGYAKYENNPKTPLSGLSITLKRNDTIVGTPYLTGITGYYEFKNLINGTYKLDIKSAHPSGNWQTWSGVNNTDYLLALRHATTGPLLPENPPVVRVSGDVKAPKTPPLITIVDADAIRMAAKYGWGTPKPWFDIPKWVFSGLTAATRIDSIVLVCSNLTREIRGLCASDVNGSFTDC
jgi:hypothetical protein